MRLPDDPLSHKNLNSRGESEVSTVLGPRKSH